ncbi:hypothetical protein H257_04591 [Aphanomyces astaci]|uniref:Peptidase A2 domain-containing protein n=1 Tax=Aphanomyces astaci TaxID=112090 RepID=W4GSV1_APHAT|nr:hypothetical protein H257_04591 [Aphanomyces astaci]ETV82810.1 hypothetical protein H257_04591 [Aphanomyces astaci]|eukprot:XP_009827481.1 hypothetical protein H257_04591 [Aphanomyces astaci]
MPSAGRHSYSEALHICFRGGAFSAVLDITFSTPVMSATEIPLLMDGFGSSVVALFMQLGGASTPRPPMSSPISSATPTCLFESVAANIIGTISLAKEGAIEYPMLFVFFPVVVHAFDIVVSSIGILCVSEPGPTESDPMTTLQRRYSITYLFALARWLHFASAAPGAIHWRWYDNIPPTRKRQRMPKSDHGRVTGSRSPEDAPLGAPLRTRSDLPDDDSRLLSTSVPRHMLPLHQQLKQMAIQCRCQLTTTRRTLERAGAPTAADIFGLDQGLNTRFYAQEVSGADQRSVVQWIAWFNRDHHSITNDELVAWFKSAFVEAPQDLDVLKQHLQRAIRFDTKILDAESLVGRMLDELMRSLEQDHQEWVLHQEGKMVVEVMMKSIKPESLKTAVQKQLQLQRNKALKSDVFRYVNWLRTFAAGHQLYVGLDDESKLSPAAKPVEAPRGGKPHVPRRDSGREDAAKNNGRVGGKAETIVPKNAEPSARKGCLKCGDMTHRVARCPKTAPGEAETSLAAQVKRWKDGIKVLVNQPQRQKTERGVLLEYIVRVVDVLLDSGSDVTVVTRGVMNALDAAGVKVGTVSHSVPHLAYPYGSDAKPVVMTRSVKFNCVTLDTTYGPLVLRRLKAWVDDASTATELIVSRPVMDLLGFSVEDLLVGAKKKKEELDVSSVPTNELSGMANVKRLMAEMLNPPELDSNDGMECDTPEVYPKTSVEDEVERCRSSHSGGQDSRGGDARACAL